MLIISLRVAVGMSFCVLNIFVVAINYSLLSSKSFLYACFFWMWLFLSIHDRLDQLHCNTASGHDRPKRVSSDIKYQITREQALELVTPCFSAGTHFSGKRIKLDYYPFVLRRPFVFERINGAEVKVNCFDIHAFLMNSLDILHRLDNFRSYLPHNGICLHLWWNHQHTFRREGAEISNFALGDRKSTRLNSSHSQISYAVFCLKKKKKNKVYS